MRPIRSEKTCKQGTRSWGKKGVQAQFSRTTNAQRAINDGDLVAISQEK
jgi:hypothetical protein